MWNSLTSVYSCAKQFSNFFSILSSPTDITKPEIQDNFDRSIREPLLMRDTRILQLFLLFCWNSQHVHLPDDFIKHRRSIIKYINFHCVTAMLNQIIPEFTHDVICVFVYLYYRSIFSILLFAFMEPKNDDIGVRIKYLF